MLLCFSLEGRSMGFRSPLGDGKVSLYQIVIMATVKILGSSLLAYRWYVDTGACADRLG